MQPPVILALFSAASLSRFARKAIWLVSLVVVLAACAGTPEPQPPPEISGGLGSIGVTAAAAPPLVRVIPLPVGMLSGAANGAGAAVAGAVNGCLDVDPTYLCALVALIGTPWLAAGGVFYGVATVKEPEEVRAATQAIDDFLMREQFQVLLADAVTEAARAKGNGLSAARPRGHADALRGTSQVGKWAANGPKELPGFDTILKVQVLEVNLGKRPAVNPSLPLRIEARASMLRATNGQELRRKKYAYRSRKTLAYGGWAANGAAALRSELKVGYDELASLIMADFLPALR